MHLGFQTKMNSRGFSIILIALNTIYCAYGAAASSCYIPILSADHTSGIDGQYFNFDNHRMNTLALGKTVKFNAVNPRTGSFGEVIVWGSPNGGSVGNSHGRFNYKPVKPAGKQWRTGDRLVPVKGMYCGTESFPMYSVAITSVDHAFGPSHLGQYFNFNREAVDGLAVGGTLKFKAFNPRTGDYGEVVVWGSKNGGSTGNSHGRFNNSPLAPKPGQWKTGDRLVPVACV